MKRPFLFQPPALASFSLVLLLALGWFALRGNDNKRASAAKESVSPASTTQAEASQPEPRAVQASFAKAKETGQTPEAPETPEGGQPDGVCCPDGPHQAGAHSERLVGQPLPRDFLDKAVQGDTIRLTLPDNTAISAKIRHLERDADGVLVVEARFENPEPGQLLIQRQTAPGVMGPFVGDVLFDDKDEAWKIEPTQDRTEARFVASSVDDIICRGVAMPPDNIQEAGDTQLAPQDFPTDVPIPDYQPVIPLESLPGATGVIYLDFDGEAGPFVYWGDFDAEPANASNAEIFDIWKRVSEDYQGFNLNVTTDRKVFEAAPAGRRQQIIITPTNDARPGAGGVARTGSFNFDSGIVCWSFSQTGKVASEVISHEVGHTLRLKHHGRTSPQEGYYLGHGSGDVGWAPIMGIGYYQNLSQWSKGEYLNANRSSQDDLEIIANGNNDIGYRNDDYGDTLAGAGYLEIFSGGSVDNEGIIGRSGDVDAFRFETSGGTVNLNIDTVSLGPNLDIHAEIIRADTLELVLADNPLDGINATLSTTLAAGEYLLRVRGTGRGDPLGDGYTDYGSLGAYLISGTVQNGLQPERLSIAENSAIGSTIGSVTPGNDHGSAAISFSIASGNTGGAFALDSATGMFSVADASVLDYEKLSTRWDDPAVITPFVSITNPDDPSLNETLRVVVEILDVNEAPGIAATPFRVPERTAPGTLLTTVDGSDPDRFQIVNFSIDSGNDDGAFAIDPSLGEVTMAQSIEVGATLTRQLTLAVTETNTGSPITVTTTIDVTVVDHGATAASGQIRRTLYENIAGTGIASLTSDPDFPNNPNREITLDAFDGGELGDDYGSTLRAYLIIPATGDYQFRIAADDSGSLLFAADGDPASAIEIASNASSTSRYQWDQYSSQLSSVISLQEGQICYIDARQKESTVSDHVAVAWTGPQIPDPEVIPGRFLIPFYQNYLPGIPEATFSVRENAIPGQSVGLVTAVDGNTGETFSSFEILGGTGQAYFAIDADTGRITVAAPLDITSSPLTLDLRVSDHGTPPLSGEGSIHIEITPADTIATTGIIQQIWSDLSGTGIADLTGQPSYPNSPSSTRTLTGGFDSGTNFGENYGSRIRALVTPPTSGEYTFYISTDDNGQLLMSSDSNATNATTIAQVDSWAGPGDWTKFASQTAAPRQLTAGESYYIEALHKEGSGGDHVQVAWTGPGIATPTIIPASALEPYNINAAPEFDAPSYAFTLDASLPIGTEIGTVTAADQEGETLTYAITAGNEGGHFAIDADGRITYASDNLLFNGIAELTVIAQDGGIDGRYPLKSGTVNVSIDVSNVQNQVSPVPDPMDWSQPPELATPTSLTMTAVAAFGEGGVEYFFECLTPGGTNSGWQASRTYTDTGLWPETTYSYRVQARDKSLEQNTTGWSATASATTGSTSSVAVTHSKTVPGARTANGANVRITEPGWSLTGGNAVAVYFTAENAQSFTASFGGQPMTVVEIFDGNNFLAGIAYLINPNVTVGDVIIDAINSGGSRLSHAYSILSLSGVDSVAASDSRTSDGDLTYTTASEAGYVLSAAVNNSYNGSTLPAVSGNPGVTLLQAAVDGNASMLHAHGAVAVAGSYTDSYSGGIESAATLAFNSAGSSSFNNWTDTYPGLSETNPSLDYDEGGLPTALEWALGGDPTDPGDDSSLAPNLDATSDPDGKLLFVFRRNAAAKADSDTTITVVFGSDLSSWTTATHQGTGPGDITISEETDGFEAGIDRVTVALPPSITAEEKLFVRLRIEISI